METCVYVGEDICVYLYVYVPTWSGIPISLRKTILPVSWETCMRVKKQELELCMEQLIGSRSRKEYVSCPLSSCLFNLHAEHIMRNASLDEFQAGVKIGGRNINNLRYAYDTTPMAESKEDLKSLLVRLKESERAGLD